MMQGDAEHPGGRLPLAFENDAQFKELKKELADLLESLRVDGQPITAEARVTGSATTFYSMNPRKALGHHYDQLGPGTGDVEIELFSPELATSMLLDQRTVASDWGIVGGQRTIFKNTGPGGVHERFPGIQRFCKRWSERLGREVDIRLQIDLSPISSVPRTATGPGPIEIYRKE